MPDAPPPNSDTSSNNTTINNGAAPAAFPLPDLKPPYYAVIFTSTRKPPPMDATNQAAADEYTPTVIRMIELAQNRPGYLGLEHVGSSSGKGEAGEGQQQSVTISYWEDEASIKGWRADAEHRAAIARGRREWYERFEIRVCRVERGYGFFG